MAGGWLTLKWMLPSPKWPKGTGRQPGTISSTRALARSISSGMRPTGTETSCLILPPSCLCTSESSSRSRQKACAWARLEASAASAICPSSWAAASRPSSSALVRPSARAPESSTSAYQRYGRSSGSRVPDPCFRANSMPMRGISSKVVSARPEASRAAAKKRAAWSRLSKPPMAVARSAGRGASLSTAAVMMPSVPSEPMKRSFKS